MAASKQSTTHVNVYLIGVLCFAILALVIGGFKLLRHNTSISTMPSQVPNQASPTINTTRIDTGEGSYAISTSIPHQMKFVSPKLGISFLYLSELGDKAPHQLFTVKEVGDKVYLYDPQMGAYTEGKFFQVFPKNPQDDLTMAIQKDVLQGYSSQDCFAETTTSFTGVSKYQPTYEVAIIAFPHSKEYMTPEYIQASGKCPQPYTPTNYVAYFVMDKNHPDKLVFLDLGQQPITSGEERSGEETLEILN